ncbi:aminoalkylphosphonate N-acetyltransferase [Klebsiella sp. BIGb0407]|uniref:aminoalkylphosphonate N-acetyltransferase n=1 Tax=Klebsiella sp. BIGb0407 TaxID=2940603 RepID=UPI002169D140|nr:aminoalkylphosphonate N-acetyltransferase [Klebsiella sp. BIGb0407]MCS3433842.1 PhnO protein [Klebsiella sp. BIGb0407]
MSDSITFTGITHEQSDIVYALICELRQDQILDSSLIKEGLIANLNNPHIKYQLAWLGTEVVGFISLQLQFHLHHARWIAEIQELVVMPQARSLGVGKALLAWAEQQARHHHAELLELSTSTKRVDAHRFYIREGYQATHLRFTKPLTYE